MCKSHSYENTGVWARICPVCWSRPLFRHRPTRRNAHVVESNLVFAYILAQFCAYVYAFYACEDATSPRVNDARGATSTALKRTCVDCAPNQRSDGSMPRSTLAYPRWVFYTFNALALVNPPYSAVAAERSCASKNTPKSARGSRASLRRIHAQKSLCTVCSVRQSLFEYSNHLRIICVAVSVTI